MPALDPEAFDPSRPIVMASSSTVGGHALNAGEALAIVDAEEPEDRGDVTLDQAKRLWARGLFVYADELRPTPVESPRDAARRTVEVDDLGGGWWMIRAPWLPEAEKLQSEEAARKRRDELIEQGHPTEIEQPVAIEQPAPDSSEPPPAPTPPARSRRATGGDEQEA